MKKNPNKFKLICTVCETEKSCNTNYKKKLIEKYGSEEEILVAYTCRGCNKKQGISKAKRKAKVNPETGETKVYHVPEMPIPRNAPALTPEELAKDNTCWRPDIWSANKKKNRGKGSCNGCPIGMALEGGVCGCHDAVVL